MGDTVSDAEKYLVLVNRGTQKNVPYFYRAVDFDSADDLRRDAERMGYRARIEKVESYFRQDSRPDGGS